MKLVALLQTPVLLAFYFSYQKCQDCVTIIVSYPVNKTTVCDSTNIKLKLTVTDGICHCCLHTTYLYISIYSFIFIY